jgi:hypothetical protein
VSGVGYQVSAVGARKRQGVLQDLNEMMECLSIGGGKGTQGFDEKLYNT